MRSRHPVSTLILALGACCLMLALPLAAETPADTGPDTVTIDGMSHWFTGVEFPHADHADMAGSCADCHHHGDGPDDINTCDSCHSLAFDPAEPETPQLKMAYHQNCIGCHRAEESGPTACIDCHARKALPEGPAHGEGRVPE